jgi:hypothetical protein
MDSRFRFLRVLALISLILAIVVFLWGLWYGLSWQGLAGYEGLTASGNLKLVLRITMFCLPFAPALFFSGLLFLAYGGLQILLDTSERVQTILKDLEPPAQKG